MSTEEIIAELPKLTAAERERIRFAIEEFPAALPEDYAAIPLSQHPAIGMWKDRDDLPDDPAAAAEVLRRRTWSSFK